MKWKCCYGEATVSFYLVVGSILKDSVNKIIKIELVMALYM